MRAEADAFLAAIVESSDDAIITKNLNGIISSWNKAAERILGYGAGEAIGQPIYILIPSELREEERGILDRLGRGERIEHYETVRVRKDGGRIDVSLTISPVRNQERNIVGASKILRDITESKRLRRREKELSNFVETAGIGLHRVGPDGTILWANAAEMELLGYKPEEYIGHHIAEFHADETAINEILGCLGKGERLCEYEARLRCKDGSIKHVLIDSSVMWEDGRFIHTQCFTRDITRRKHSEEALRQSEERYRMVFNSIDEGFCVIEVLFDSVGHPHDHRLLEINPAFERHTGLKDAAGKKASELMPGIEQDWNGIYGQVVATGEPVRFEFASEAFRRWFDVHVSRLGDKSSRKVAVVFTDITERKRTEAAIRESEERFRTLADNIAQFAWMADEKGWIFWYNKRWFEYTGTTLEEMQGWGWQKVHHPDHVERVVEKIRHSFETGEYWEDIFPLRGKDGNYRWFLSRAIPIRDEKGKVVRWLGTNTDITEQRRTEQILKRAHEQLGDHAADLEKAIAERTAHLEQTIAELEGVSYSLSHDMRAPLRTIQSFSEIVLAEAGENLGAAERDLLQKIISAANRLDRLIRDVLIYSRVSRETVELSTLDVESLLRQIIAERVEFQPPKAEIEIQTPLRRVRGHEAYLTQCITNLLDNAVKFVPAGRQPQVRIWSESTDGEVTLWFQDNGIGIAKEAQERVFGIFQRIYGEKTYPGTGIGLAIVRKAVERMGGSVGVKSGPDQGSEFWIQLPRGENER